MLRTPLDNLVLQSYAYIYISLKHRLLNLGKVSDFHDEAIPPPLPAPVSVSATLMSVHLPWAFRSRC